MIQKSYLQKKTQVDPTLASFTKFLIGIKVSMDGHVCEYVLASGENQTLKDAFDVIKGTLESDGHKYVGLANVQVSDGSRVSQMSDDEIRTAGLTEPLLKPSH